MTVCIIPSLIGKINVLLFRRVLSGKELLAVIFDYLFFNCNVTWKVALDGKKKKGLAFSLI